MDTATLIDSFSGKFDTFVERYKSLKSDNLKLTEENAALKLKISELESVLADNKKSLSTQQLANTFLTTSENNSQEAKNKINRIVREIDNCIALLNR